MSSNQDSCVVITTSDYNIFSSDYDYELLNQLENTDFKLNDLNIRNLSRTLITDSKGITGIGNLEDVKRIFGSNTDVSMNIIVSGKYLSGESPPPVSTGNSFTDIANNIKYTTQKQLFLINASILVAVCMADSYLSIAICCAFSIMGSRNHQ